MWMSRESMGDQGVKGADTWAYAWTEDPEMNRKGSGDSHCNSISRRETARWCPVTISQALHSKFHGLSAFLRLYLSYQGTVVGPARLTFLSLGFLTAQNMGKYIVCV